MARQPNIRVTGIDKVMRNLNKELKKIKSRSVKGLINAAIIIRRDMGKTPPVIPVDWGNLRASWFVTAGRGQVQEGSPTFKGPDAGKASGEHSRIVSQANAKAASSRDPLVIIGFSANYSAYVHESKEGKKWKEPGSGPGFLSSSINRNKALVLKAIADEAEIK